ncbi:MAG TPA: hypothetical protein PKV66_00780 [Candidatus Pelethenecus sp.]|nr:hypothetical protein [Candidatus Pelethenecus sp.]
METKNKTVKLLFYCTKAKPYLYGCYAESDGDIGTIGGFGYDTSYCPTEDEDSKDRTVNLNGYVVAEAECEVVEDLSKYEYAFKDNHFYDVLKNACLTTRDLEKYCPVKRGEYKRIYAIHLKNVKPFEEPKKLSEYYHWRTERKAIRSLQFTYPSQNSRTAKNYIRITSAPQNMCYADEIIVYPTYVETNFTGYEEYYENRVLISIRPEWLCKILNGEKTIEVRKSILNALKELIK